MPSRNGFTASILTEDEQAFDEYKIAPSSDGKTVVCYIECKSGQAFQVRFSCDTLPPQDEVYDGILHIDGLDEGGEYIAENGVQPVLIKGAKDFEAGQERPFQFGNLQTTDDDRMLPEDAAHLEAVGEIKLSVWRSSVQMNAAPTMGYGKAIGQLHEKCKKAQISHTVELGAPVALDDGPLVELTQLDKEPLAVFRFKYRSRDLLEAEGIIEAKPAPVAANKGRQGRKRAPTQETAAPTAAALKKVKKEIKESKPGPIDLDATSPIDKKPKKKSVVLDLD